MRYTVKPPIELLYLKSELFLQKLATTVQGLQALNHMWNLTLPLPPKLCFA